MRDYFCGWYFKCQSGRQTLAVIPAVHKSGKQKSCSVQFITAEGAHSVCFPYEHFQKEKGAFRLRIEENCFGGEGLRLRLHTPDFSAVGFLRFGALSPIRYDIMGPFRYVPFMECRHSVVSMRHTVNGKLCINGVNYCFDGADGYIEGDRGYSFPKQYAWTQCFFKDGSLFLSTADIPAGSFHFTGIIGIIRYRNKEYRLATYLGAKAVKIGEGEIVVCQGGMTFSARLTEAHAHPLLAPASGAMNRTIHESITCRACYCFQQNGQRLFSFETDQASFEYEYPF